MYTYAGDRHEYDIVFLTRFTITNAYQDDADGGFLILVNQLPICECGKDVILCSKPIYMDLHLIKNVKSPFHKSDAVNKAYVDRIKYKRDTGIIPNTFMTDRILFTF